MTLGQVLKSKRLELGKSIEQIATATRIHLKVLKALEEDHYADLPARAFTRGFIISYCKALNLNPDEILRDYHDFLESKYAERPEKDHGHHGYAFESKESEQNKRGMYIIAGVAAFFAIITLLFFKPQNHRHKEKHKELIAEESEMAAAVDANASPTPMETNGASPAASASPTAVTAITATSAATAPSATPASTATPVATTTPKSTPVATATPTPSPSPAAQATPKEDPMNKGDEIQHKDAVIKITLVAQEDVLIRYHADQKKPFAITLRKDKQLVIKAMQIIKVETASPERLKYKLNFKNKAGKALSELTQSRLELRADGTEATFNAGSL